MVPDEMHVGVACAPFNSVRAFKGLHKQQAVRLAAAEGQQQFAGW